MAPSKNLRTGIELSQSAGFGDADKRAVVTGR